MKSFQGCRGADMLELTWDDELAETALKAATYNCRDKNLNHDACKLSPKFDSVGQNLFSKSLSSVAIPDCQLAIDSW